jgi:hypothetical protein
VAQKKTGNFSSNDLFFEFHDIAMKRGNMSGRGQQKFSTTGALRTAMLLTAMTSASLPAPPTALNFSRVPFYVFGASGGWWRW